MGRLKDAVPESMVEEFPRLRRLRNALAHEVLMRWRFETNLGLATHDEVADSLAEVANDFDHYAAVIDTAAANLREQLGIPEEPFTRAELIEILEREDVGGERPRND